MNPKDFTIGLAVGGIVASVIGYGIPDLKRKESSTPHKSWYEDYQKEREEYLEEADEMGYFGAESSGADSEYECECCGKTALPGEGLCEECVACYICGDGEGLCDSEGCRGKHEEYMMDNWDAESFEAPTDWDCKHENWHPLGHFHTGMGSPDTMWILCDDCGRYGQIHFRPSFDTKGSPRAKNEWLKMKNATYEGGVKLFDSESFEVEGLWDVGRKKTKKEIIEYLLENCEGDWGEDEIFHTVNDEKWTLADLFVRQWLNNGGDGFGMENVHEVFGYLVENKEQLIEYDLISKDGTNNSGYPLWEDYDFEDVEILGEYDAEEDTKWLVIMSDELKKCPFCSKDFDDDWWDALWDSSDWVTDEGGVGEFYREIWTECPHCGEDFGVQDADFIYGEGFFADDSSIESNAEGYAYGSTGDTLIHWEDQMGYSSPSMPPLDIHWAEEEEEEVCSMCENTDMCFVSDCDLCTTCCDQDVTEDLWHPYEGDYEKDWDAGAESFSAQAVENEVGCDSCNRFAKLWFYPNVGLNLCAKCSKKYGLRASGGRYEAPQWANKEIKDAEDKDLYCCICGIHLLSTGEKYGHNPDPIDRLPNVCCGDCNATVVIPARIKQIFGPED